MWEIHTLHARWQKEEGQEKLKKETPELFVELKARSFLVT